MTERVQRRRTGQRTDAQAEPEQQPSTSAVDYDALLDEIDTVLEADAEEYVRSFVQKGGQ